MKAYCDDMDMVKARQFYRLDCISTAIRDYCIMVVSDDMDISAIRCKAYDMGYDAIGYIEKSKLWIAYK